MELYTTFVEVAPKSIRPSPEEAKALKATLVSTVSQESPPLVETEIVLEAGSATVRLLPSAEDATNAPRTLPVACHPDFGE